MYRREEKKGGLKERGYEFAKEKEGLTNDVSRD